MKLIIDIDEETYNRAKNEPSILCGMNDGLIYQSNMKEAIANGKPYNPTGDLISREALKKELSKRLWFVSSPECDAQEIIDIIDNAPTVEQKGEWIKGREISRTMLGNKVEHIDYKDYTCSNCGLVLDNLLYWHDGSPFYKFCPNCGADMGGEKE